MGRMHGSGISASALPFKRKPPTWATMTPTAITELIVKYSKKGRKKSK